MRITHVNTWDVEGGAAQAAYRLHTGLLALGHESRLFVLQKSSDDPSVVLFKPPRDKLIRARRVLRRLLLAPTEKLIKTRPPGSTYFSDDRCQHAADILGQVSPSDILHLHWIAQFIDYRDFMRRVQSMIVWTLHDMNPFTGGCHYDGGCGKYKKQCGACPQLDSSDARDFSAQVWQRKNFAFRMVNQNSIHFVAPTRWLAAEVRKSALLGRFSMTVIPHGIDTEKFQPRDRTFARQRFGVPPDAQVVLFVAHRLREKRKGLDLLFAALKELESHPKLHLLIVGGYDTTPQKELGKLTERTTTVQFIRDERIMSLAYSAADLFVVPTLQDNGPLTALEALACGLPTVGFNVGGLPDIVREGQTGSLVPAGDVRELRNTIVELLRNPERRTAMGQMARRIAVEEHRLDVQARRYISLYEALRTAANRGAGPA
jgi:glycosyltransferase involved in cell wall biosynthesis